MVASRLRALDDDVDIEIYTREPYEYYSRIRLPEVWASDVTASDLEIYQPGWYEQRDIAVYKNTEVVAIDREARAIELKNGTRAPYDKLVLAMGSDAFKPPIENVDLDGVFTIREYGDADAVRSYIKEGTTHAVVVGGGLLGLEAARHVAEAGVESVTVIEIMARLLPKQLDETGAALLKEIIEEMGCAVVLDATVTRFLGDRSVTGLQLKDGREFPAQTVIISAGIRPRTKLAEEAGLEVNRGVVVDDHLRSSDKDIFVAGDLVEFEGIVWGIIPAALDHAPVVANNIVGNEHVKYRQTIPKNTLKVVGLDLTSVGKVVLDEEQEQEGGREGGREEARVEGREEADETARAAYEVVAKMDRAAGRYEKYVLRDGELVGAILLGSKENLRWVNKHVGTPVTEAEARARLW